MRIAGRDTVKSYEFIEDAIGTGVLRKGGLRCWLALGDATNNERADCGGCDPEKSAYQEGFSFCRNLTSISGNG